MHYEGVLYRPPSESQSLLIQMTVGCSYNRCTFCAMYDETEYQLKPVETVLEDISEGTSYRFRRVFLCDGDALIAPMPYLEKVLRAIREKMPTVERVGIYGDPRSILKKSADDLKHLKELGLGVIYHGIESGDDKTLKAVKKGVTAEQTVSAGKRVKEAGIQYSAIVLLGIGGRTRSHEHARATAEVLNQIQPDFIGILTTMVTEGTPLYELAERGKFSLPSRFGLIEELKTIVESLELKKGLLTSKHASNYLDLRVVFPYEKHQAVKLLANVLEKRDEELLKPEFQRGL
jgi:radical SAM superfamily enzyme YgiQ (UPF0313 family)